MILKETGPPIIIIIILAQNGKNGSNHLIVGRSPNSIICSTSAYACNQSQSVSCYLSAIADADDDSCADDAEDDNFADDADDGCLMMVMMVLLRKIP